MSAIKVVNLVGKPITVGDTAFPLEGEATVGAVQTIEAHCQTEHGSFLLVRESSVAGLPEYDGQTRYIVTREVANAAIANGRPGYDLLYSPDALPDDDDERPEYQVLTCAQWP